MHRSTVHNRTLGRLQAVFFLLPHIAALTALSLLAVGTHLNFSVVQDAARVVTGVSSEAALVGWSSAHFSRDCLLGR